MKCPSCKQPCSDDVKREFMENYPWAFAESRSPAAILARVDCHVSDLTSNRFQKLGFCPTKHVITYPGMYSIRSWWVFDGKQLEKWQIGPGGFFQEDAQQCERTQETT